MNTDKDRQAQVVEAVEDRLRDTSAPFLEGPLLDTAVQIWRDFADETDVSRTQKPETWAAASTTSPKQPGVATKTPSASGDNSSGNGSPSRTRRSATPNGAASWSRCLEECAPSEPAVARSRFFIETVPSDRHPTKRSP